MIERLTTQTCVKIDEGYEEHNYFGKNKMWITLLDCCKGKSCSFRIHYKDTYKGSTYEGDVDDVHGNGTWTVNDDPQIDVTISNWSCDGSHVTFHLKIVIHKVGPHTLFDQDLAGEIPDKAQLAEEFRHQLAAFEKMAQA